MKNKLPCELIRDLFPSYIDGLTSDVTNEAVEEHVSECRNCREILDAMREPSAGSESEHRREEEEEIDFLKKTRMKTRKIILGTMLAAVLMVAAVLLARAYFVGSYIYSKNILCQVDVDGNHLSVNGTAADPGLAISSVEYKETDGIVTISFKAVNKSMFHKGDFQSEFESTQEITQVCLDEQIIWSRGVNISAITSAVYNSRHPYVGDMPANGNTIVAMNMVSQLGNFKNQLQTSEEPYGWTMTLETEIEISQQAKKEQDMRSCAYLLLAVIDNLGEVSFEYYVNGEMYMITVDLSDASEFAGQDIKACGRDVIKLQKLIEKTGLNACTYIY